MKQFLLILLFFLLKTSGVLHCQDLSQYNILWITCEDISPNIGAYGDKVAKTPNIDRLAKEGVKFTNVISPSGVCAPSRSAIITGMYPTSVGTHHMRTNWNVPDTIIPYEAVIPEEVKCFPEFLRRNGYYCTNNEKNDLQFKAPITAWDENGADAHWKNRADGQPFFSVINLNDTHESMIWKNADHPQYILPKNVKVPPYYPDIPIVRNDITRNYSNIYEMDQKVGAIISQLEQDNLLDKTIVFFYSDHGGPLPRQKREINNGGLQVPFIIRYPDKRDAGTTNDELISFIDLAPTMVSITDSKMPDYFQGRIFLGKDKEPPPQYLFAARDRLDKQYDIVRSVRNKQFIYIKNYKPEKPWYMDIAYRKNMPLMQELLRLKDKDSLNEVQMKWFASQKPSEELYDFINDPYEVRNLSDNPEYAPVLSNMREALSDWKNKYRDYGFTSEYDMITEMWPGWIQPRTERPSMMIKENKLVLSTNTKGASIVYKQIDNSKRNDDWSLYEQPLQFEDNTYIFSKAIRIGYQESTVGCLKESDPEKEEKYINKRIKQNNTKTKIEIINDKLFIKGKSFNELKVLDSQGRLYMHFNKNDLRKNIEVALCTIRSDTYNFLFINPSEVFIQKKVLKCSIL